MNFEFLCCYVYVIIVFIILIKNYIASIPINSSISLPIKIYYTLMVYFGNGFCNKFSFISNNHILYFFWHKRSYLYLGILRTRTWETLNNIMQFTWLFQLWRYWHNKRFLCYMLCILLSVDFIYLKINYLYGIKKPYCYFKICVTRIHLLGKINL